MKIYKNCGEFEILNKPENVISVIANAARTCYQSFEKSGEDSDKKLVENLIKRGHFAMLEFCDITVKFKNVSRGLTHELVRHRIASFAQESTRYVDEKDFEIVFPPNLEENHSICGDLTISEICKQNESVYRKLRNDGFKAEDARQFLYTAQVSEIVFKVSLRELRHIFKMRCDHFAHWEIRSIMVKLLAWCKENIPVVFDDFHFFKLGNIDYARPIYSSFELSEFIKDYYLSEKSLKEVLDKLPINLKNELKELLND